MRMRRIKGGLHRSICGRVEIRRLPSKRERWEVVVNGVVLTDKWPRRKAAELAARTHLAKQPTKAIAE